MCRSSQVAVSERYWDVVWMGGGGGGEKTPRRIKTRL